MWICTNSTIVSRRFAKTNHQLLHILRWRALIRALEIIFDTTDIPCSQGAYNLLRLSNINRPTHKHLYNHKLRWTRWRRNTRSLAQGDHYLEWGLKGEFSWSRVNVCGVSVSKCKYLVKDPPDRGQYMERFWKGHVYRPFEDRNAS